MSKQSPFEYLRMDRIKTWSEFNCEAPELAETGQNLLFCARPYVGYAFLATLRKDGAPRLHPVSIVLHGGHLYVIIPPSSPKCADLLRDGRYALQVFPREKQADYEEYFLSGRAEHIQDQEVRQNLIADTDILVEEHEVLFELLLDRAMHTRLAERGTPQEHPVHAKWRAA